MRVLRTAIGCFFIAVAVAGVNRGSLVQKAPAAAAELMNPLEGDEQAQRAGAKLYARECASCHGVMREGGRKAPPLIQPEVQEAPSGTLFWVLRNGSLHRGMPSFAHLPEAQRWQIVTFLKTGLNRADGR
jgi:mono/diheme cytochrome c family protein